MPATAIERWSRPCPHLALRPVCAGSLQREEDGAEASRADLLEQLILLLHAHASDLFATRSKRSTSTRAKPPSHNPRLSPQKVVSRINVNRPYRTVNSHAAVTHREHSDLDDLDPKLGGCQQRPAPPLWPLSIEHWSLSISNGVKCEQNVEQRRSSSAPDASVPPRSPFDMDHSRP